MCPEGCEKHFRYPEPPDVGIGDWPASATPIPVADSEQRPRPEPTCRCGFKFNNFDKDERTCSGGCQRPEDLTRVDHSPGVYYYRNADGDGVDTCSVGYKKSFENKMDTEMTVDEAIAVCRRHPDCRGFRYKEGERPEMFTAECQSPCYKRNYYRKTYYHVDYTNPWLRNDTGLTTYGVTYRFRVDISEISVADDIYHSIGSAKQQFADGVKAGLAADQSENGVQWEQLVFSIAHVQHERGNMTATEPAAEDEVLREDEDLPPTPEPGSILEPGEEPQPPIGDELEQQNSTLPDKSSGAHWHANSLDMARTLLILTFVVCI
jgi:hypothetical protein